MKFYSSLLLTLLLCTGVASAQNSKYVNPLIGTGSMGHVFPGAVVPHGLVALSPDTDTIPHNVNGVYQKRSYEYCAGYQYNDPTIVGFSHTHLSGTGHSDLGDILVMPTSGDLKLNPGVADKTGSGFRSAYDKTSEVSKPGYYKVQLTDNNIKAELTATERVGVHRYTFADSAARMILDMVHGIYNYDGKVLWSSIRVESPTLVTGYRITNGWARENYQYFAMEFSEPIVNYGYKEFEKVNYGGGWRKFNLTSNFPEIAGRKIRAYFEFDTNKPLEVKVALSSVGVDGALKNLEAEASGKSFDQIAHRAASEWDKELNRIEVKGTDDQMAMIYTALYHTMINPSVYQDVDGRYRGLDGQIHTADGFTNYTVFSLWDTYRALHPWFNLVNRERNRDMAASMMAHRDQSVHKILPVWSHMANENWCMIGYHGVSVLSDAIAKGLDVDRTKAIEAMNSSATLPYYEYLGDYMQLGYVPHDKSTSGASMTLEYAYDDWAIFRAAQLSGNKELAAKYAERAQNYRKIFDRHIGFARPRYSDGRWKENFSTLNTHGEGFIEGNTWNYSFFVPHDVVGLVAEMGGKQRFTERLDSLMTMELPDEFFEHTEDVTKEGIMGNYVHGNEPAHHILYLYNWTDEPWKGQYWLREVMNTKYRNVIDGLCGNDDCGQMSAWYLFTAMGFYPVCPGTDQLVLGAPYVPYMKLNLENGKSFEMTANGVSDKNRYVKSVKLNGKPYTKAYITNDDILKGGRLEFEMTSKPNKNRLFKGDDLPYSMSTDWSEYNTGEVEFIDKNPETKGSQIYNSIVTDKQKYISDAARKVLSTLYFSAEDSIPQIKNIKYTIADYNGVSDKGGAPPAIAIRYSTQWIEKSFGDTCDTARLEYETLGVLYHELTHGFQLEPQGIGTYGTNRTFFAFIEGVADAVRYLNGSFTLKDRPKGGKYTDGYRTTGFFLAWLTKTKNPDFLRLFNRSAIELDVWSFDGAIKHVLGPQYNIDDLWTEYLTAMGDI